MAVTALDTHEVVKELRAVGFTDEQAEAVTRVIRKAQEIDLSELVTRADFQLGMAATKSDLKNELAAVRSDLKNELAAVRSDLKTGIAATKSDLQTGLAAAKSDLRIGLAETKSEILKWMVGTIGAQTVIILGAVAALARFAPH